MSKRFEELEFSPNDQEFIDWAQFLTNKLNIILTEYKQNNQPEYDKNLKDILLHSLFMFNDFEFDTKTAKPTEPEWKSVLSDNESIDVMSNFYAKIIQAYYKKIFLSEYPDSTWIDYANELPNNQSMQKQILAAFNQAILRLDFIKILGLPLRI